jgi:hypothetical protein
MPGEANPFAGYDEAMLKRYGLDKALLQRTPTAVPSQSVNEIQTTQGPKIVSYHAPERRESVNLLFDEREQLLRRIVIAWREQDTKAGSSRTYDRSGKLKWSERYLYDNDGYTKSLERLDPNGELVVRTIFQRDDAGNLIGTEVVDAEGNPVPPAEWGK